MDFDITVYQTPKAKLIKEGQNVPSPTTITDFPTSRLEELVHEAASLKLADYLSLASASAIMATGAVLKVDYVAKKMSASPGIVDFLYNNELSLAEGTAAIAGAFALAWAYAKYRE